MKKIVFGLLLSISHFGFTQTTRYGYVPRDASSQINWAKVGEDSNKMLQEVLRDREEKKSKVMSSDYILKGNSKFALQDYQGALFFYSKAIELNPSESNSYYNRGLAKSHLEDYRGAIADYTIAIELKPNSGLFYYNRGLAKLQLNQKDSGCLDLSTAGELGETDAYEDIKQYCN